MQCIAGLLLCMVLHHVGAWGRQLSPPISWPADYWEESETSADPTRTEGLPQLVGRGPQIPESAEVPGRLFDWPQGFWEDNDPRSHYVLVYPPKKLAFCFIPKNACAEFNYLFNHMNNIEHKYQLQRSSLGALGLKVEDVSREKGWKWAVFLRDPLVRYLSAWGSKCVKEEDHGRYCIHGKVAPNATVNEFKESVLATRDDPKSIQFDPHWNLQQEACGGLGNGEGYDFIGHLDGSVNKQVNNMLRMVGAPGRWVNKFFPKKGVHGHRSSLDPHLYYRNATIKQAVSDVYARDYDLPGLQ